jgi:outer membrane receptor protein involved in Fe transport
MSLTSTATAQGQKNGPGVHNISIPAEPLADALNELAQQAGLQILFASDLVAKLRSEPLKGSLTADEALRRLLSNTGMSFEFVNPHTITIVGPAAPVPKPTDQDSGSQTTPTPGSVTEAHSEDSGDNRMHRSTTLKRLLGLVAICGSAVNPGTSCADDASAAGSASTVLDTVVVTARRRDESLAEVPSSISVFSAAAIEDFDIQSFDDYGTKVPNLSFEYGSGALGITGARTVAIRGVSGQNVVGTAGATGFYIDDTPVPSSLDPRVLDVDNIEVLRGPQGTLFGESSLGGNVRIITKKPSLVEDGIGYMMQTGLTSRAGSPDVGGNVIGNVVLVPDSLALRAVLFVNHDAGYLTRTFSAPSSQAVTDPFLSAPRTSVGDQGADTSYGGSLTALLKASETIDAEIRVMFQNTAYHGFPATFAPLPAFVPVYTLNRAFDVQPTASDDWALPSLDIKYHDRGWQVVSSTSFFYRHTRDTEDSTYGTQQILSGYYGVNGLPAQPFMWTGEILTDQLTQELRASFDAVHNLSGTFGAFYSRTHTRQFIPPTNANGLVAATADNAVVGPWPNDLLWVNNLPVNQRDTSIFGELYYKFLERFNLTVGARQYWLKQNADYTADGFLNFGPTPSFPTQNAESGASPKFALSYDATDKVMTYASASKGFRSGGAQTYAPFCAQPGLSLTDITKVRSDTLWTYEAGTKVQVPNPGLLITAAAFYIDWRNFHEQVALPCGLNFVINGDQATIRGGEFEVSGHLMRELLVRFGAGYENARVSNPGELGVVGIAPGSRMVGTPQWTASVGAVYTRSIADGMEGIVSADYSYTGDSTSLLNQSGGILATRPSYSLANLRFGIHRGPSELSLNIRNLTNAKPNLGDIGYNGYVQHDAQGAPIPTVATLQPLTAVLQYQKSF